MICLDYHQGYEWITPAESTRSSTTSHFRMTCWGEGEPKEHTCTPFAITVRRAYDCHVPPFESECPQMEFRLGQVEHGKEAGTRTKPKDKPYLGCIRRSTIRLATPHWHQASRHDSHSKNTSNQAPITPARPIPSQEGAVASHSNHHLRRQRFHTPPPAPSGFYSQDMTAKWASARLHASSQPDSQPLHIRRCLRRVRPQQKAVDRFDSPSSVVQQAWDERPWNMG